MHKHRFVFATATLLALLVMSTGAKNAHAQFRIGPHVGYSFDVEELFIGADAWVGIYKLSDMVEIHGNLEISYYLTEIGTLMQFAIHVPFVFDVGSEIVKPYVGPGIGMYWAKVTIEIFGVEESASDTDFAFNVIGGALFLPDQMVNPFAGLRLSLEEDTNLELMGGVMFQF